MKDDILIGHSDMRHFRAWCESRLPSWVIIYCRKGTACISLLFKKYAVVPGRVFYISPDLYPSLYDVSPDFEATYFISSDAFMSNVFHGIPADFFTAIFQYPFIPADGTIASWLDFIEVAASGADSFQEQILTDLLHSYTIVHFQELQKAHGDTFSLDSPPTEVLCNKFYILLMADCREHREVTHYAGKLCISANYLAMILRKYYNESPKQAIARQVVAEIKHLLLHTDLNISTIAHNLHFPDASYMCRYFKKETRQALTDYRRSL